MGHARDYRRALVILALVLTGCASPKGVTIHLPPEARCRIETIHDRHVVVCICDDDCWETAP